MTRFFYYSRLNTMNMPWIWISYTNYYMHSFLIYKKFWNRNSKPQMEWILLSHLIDNIIVWINTWNKKIFAASERYHWSDFIYKISTQSTHSRIYRDVCATKTILSFSHTFYTYHSSLGMPSQNCSGIRREIQR